MLIFWIFRFFKRLNELKKFKRLLKYQQIHCNKKKVTWLLDNIFTQLFQ